MAQLYLQRDQPPASRPSSSPASARSPTSRRRTTGTSATSSSTSGSPQRVGGRRVVDLACGEGYGSAVLGAHGRVRRRRRRQPGGLRARAAEVLGPEAPLRAQHARAVGRATSTASCSCRRSSTSRTPTPCSRGCATLIGPGRRRLRLDAERAHAGAEGRERSGNPWHVREYRAEEYRALCERHFGSVELLGLFHARKLRAHQVAIERLGWDRVHRALRFTKPFYDRFTPAISRARLRAATAASWTARSTSSPCCAREPAPGASASSSTPTCPTSRATGRGRSARSGCGRRSRPPTCRCSTRSTRARAASRCR